jgi:hypothetical protein
VICVAIFAGVYPAAFRRHDEGLDLLAFANGNITVGYHAHYDDGAEFSVEKHGARSQPVVHIASALA